jgi:hypothetical protein
MDEPDHEEDPIFSVGHDHDKRRVILQLAIPTAWLSLSPEAAIELANLLDHHARLANGGERVTHNPEAPHLAPGEEP